MFVCEMKTVLKLECRDSRRYLSTTEDEDEEEHKSKNHNNEFAKWERIDHQDGRWKTFAETDAAKLECAWKRMEVLVRPLDFLLTPTINHRNNSLEHRYP